MLYSGRNYVEFSEHADSYSLCASISGGHPRPDRVGMISSYSYISRGLADVSEYTDAEVFL